MNNVVGLWIDHREVVLVSLGDEETETIRMESHVEKKHRLSGGARTSTPYGPQEVAAEHKLEERRKHQMDRFFEGLMVHLRTAERIFIMGPGDAKLKLVRYLQHQHEIGHHIAAVETRDKMTENQIVAAVAEFFEQQPTR